MKHSLGLNPVPLACVPQTAVIFIHLQDVGHVSVLSLYELLDVFLSIHFNSCSMHLALKSLVFCAYDIYFSNTHVLMYHTLRTTAPS